MLSYFNRKRDSISSRESTEEKKDSSESTESLESESVHTVFSAKSDLDSFPSSINKPTEQIRYENLSDDETKLCEYIATNYKSQIEECLFWTEDVIPRFVTDTYYVKDYQKRLELTCTRFDGFLEQYHRYHFHDILTNPELNTPQKLEEIEEDNDTTSAYYYGIDHEGHPIMYVDQSFSSKISTKRAHETFCADNFERANFQRFRMKRIAVDLCEQIGIHYGCEISKSVVVVDLKNATINQFYTNREYFAWFCKTNSALFPETMHKSFIINAPRMFLMVWKICKQFLDESTVRKTVILGSDYLEEMKKYIDIEMIPKSLGGEGKWEPRFGDVPVEFPIQVSKYECSNEEDQDVANEEDQGVANEENQIVADEEHHSADCSNASDLSVE